MRLHDLADEWRAAEQRLRDAQLVYAAQVHAGSSGEANLPGPDELDALHRLRVDADAKLALLIAEFDRQLALLDRI